MRWLTTGRLTSILRVVSMLIALWSGSQAVQGYQIVAARPDGVASVTAADTTRITGNGVLAALMAFAAANRKLIEAGLARIGVPGGVTATAIDVGRLTAYWELYKRANSTEERNELRAVARRVSDELFEELFPPVKSEGKT